MILTFLLQESINSQKKASRHERNNKFMNPSLGIMLIVQQEHQPSSVMYDCRNGIMFKRL